MTAENRPTAAEAREQALGMIRRALWLYKGHMRTGFQRAIERAQEARAVEVLTALPCDYIHYADALLSRGRLTEARTVASRAGSPECECGRCLAVRQAEARLDALAEEE